MVCSNLSQVEEKAILIQHDVKGGMNCTQVRPHTAVSSNSPLAIAKAGQNEKEK